MDKVVRFSVDDIQLVAPDNYSADEFAIARFGFLGSNKNAHKLNISNDVLINCASSVLGKWVVAKINPLTKDCEGHETDEVITGYFPMEQEVVFKKTKEGYIRAFADAVVSKVYASDYCAIFENGEKRDVSVEMTMTTAHGKELDDDVLDFNILGVTTLGRGIKPSSPTSETEFIRFSEQEANAYFQKSKNQIVEMEENYVNHPIDSSKESVDEGEWDGEQAKQDLIKEEKFETLAPKVCLRLEDGWEERQITKLGYPVMCLKDGKWVYSRKGLASALAYAKQHEDNDIIKKVEDIYKELGFETARKEESAEMTEIEFAAINIGELWDKLRNALRERYPYDDYGCWYWIDSIWEDGNTKFAIICKRDTEERYRLDFTYTEDGITLADEITEVKVQIVETDVVRRFAEPENIADYQKEKESNLEEVCEKCGKPIAECECGDDDDDSDDDEVVMAQKVEELAARIKQLEADIADKENIIMEKDAELATLREYQNVKMSEDKAKVVGSLLESLKEFMSDEETEQYRNEGMACNFAEMDNWSNKIKASVVDKAIKKDKGNAEFMRIASPEVHKETKPSSVWERI